MGLQSALGVLWKDYKGKWKKSKEKVGGKGVEERGGEREKKDLGKTIFRGKVRKRHRYNL